MISVEKCFHFHFSFFLFLNMRRMFFAALVAFGIVICEKSSINFQADRFYNDAKEFLLCRFCQEIQRGNGVAAQQCLNLLTEMNRVFEKDPSDGFPIELQSTPPPRSRISAIFNHRENVLRHLAEGQLNWAAVGLNIDSAETLCMSMKCASASFDK